MGANEVSRVTVRQWQMVYIAKQIYTYGPKEVRTGSGEREVHSKENR